MNKLQQLIDNQIRFQKLVGFPIDTNLESERNELAEIYVFKMIEEAVELRKEFPSVMNRWSKKQKPADINRIQEEFCDVVFFLMNFMIVFKLTPDEVIEKLLEVQKNNFNKIKGKMMDSLNQDILRIQNSVNGIGQGNLTPKYVIIGQNPASGIVQGYKFWSNPNDGSSKVLLPILDDLGITKDCYFTNIVKCTTQANREPTPEMTTFYTEFLKKELEILRTNNPDMKIITLGRWADDNLLEPHVHVSHPGLILRGGMKQKDYEDEIKKAFTYSN